MLSRIILSFFALAFLPTAAGAQQYQAQPRLSQGLYEQSMHCIGRFRGASDLLVLLMTQNPNNPTLEQSRRASADLWEAIDIMDALIYSEERGLNLAAGQAIHDAARAPFQNRESQPYSENFAYYKAYGEVSEQCLSVLVALEDRLT